jgi:hypothetical protein
MEEVRPQPKDQLLVELMVKMFNGTSYRMHYHGNSGDGSNDNSDE